MMTIAKYVWAKAKGFAQKIKPHPRLSTAKAVQAREELVPNNL
jgi:hypothetical protein